MNFKFLFLLFCLTQGVAMPGISQVQPISPLVESYEEYAKMKEESVYGLKWIQLGPVINSARVEAIQVDKSRPGTMYTAFGSGGLWKTKNNGLTWKSIFENKPTLGIGDIALAPSNTNVIYLGSGESLKKARNFTMPGNGIYRSDDGGESWRHIGLEDSWHIGEITVHPTNPDIVYVAVLGHFWSANPNRGVYRSTDGGKTWEHVLFIDGKTGANDIVVSPANPDVMYASMWENYPGISGKKSGIYRSIDGGKTWMKPAEGLPEDEGKGRIGLAVSHTNPNKVYALLDHRGKGEKKGAAEVYKSVDGGKTWKRTHQKELRIFSSVGWYFVDIYVNPQNDDEIYALGVRLAHSTDGGKTFTYVGGDVHHHFPSSAGQLHLDQCELWIDPKDPDHLALANDGGLYVSYDKGKNWEHFNNIPTGEFYDIALDSSDPYTVYGGVQDDATVYGKADEWNPRYPDGWKYLWIDAWSGGDGTITAIDPVDSNTLYFSSQEGGVRRLDEKADTSISVRPDPESFHLENNIQYNFVAPYFISPHDHSTLYLGGNYIFKTTNRGDDWTVISQDLSSGHNKNKDSYAAGAVAESELEQGLLYAGTDKGLFWVTQKGDTIWTERSKGLPNAYIRSISPSRYKESRVYIAMPGLNYDDFGTYIYKSEDYGKTWTSISSNLPGEVAYVIKEDPFFKNILYAGLYRGVYISTDRGESWSLLGKNMPPAAISDVEIDKDSKDLVAATHGRGLYKMNLSPVYEKYADGIKSDYLFDVPKAKLPQYNDTHGDVNYRTAKKLPITFWVRQPQKIKLRILSKDKVLWETKINADKGFNEYRWDLITQTVDSPLPYFIHYNKFLKKGKYKVQIVTSSDTLQKDFIAVQ